MLLSMLFLLLHQLKWSLMIVKVNENHVVKDLEQSQCLANAPSLPTIEMALLPCAILVQGWTVS